MTTYRRKAGIRVGVVIASSAIVIAVMSGCGNQNSSSSSSGRFTPVQAAANQSTALRMARKEDLPALASADRIVIRTAPWAGAKEVTITDAAVLKQLRSALTVKHISPSGGKTWATLTWMNVDKKLREVWVFKYGEWGFERPSTSWTIGRNAELVAIIRKALTEVDGGRVDKSDSDNGS